MSNQRSFLIWNTAHGLPTVPHEDLPAAFQEARRLATRNPGETFLVLAPIAAVRAPVTEPALTTLALPSAEEIQAAQLDEIPF